MSRPFAAALFACVGLAACGGGGEGADGGRDAGGPSGSSGHDVAAIERTIVSSSTSDDPADCKRLHTQRFLDRSSFDTGDAAVELCEEVIQDDELAEDPEMVTVSRVQVDGRTATANAAFEGSTLDGQTVIVSLVEEDGRWKLDAKIGFAALDRDKLIEGMRREVDVFAETPLEARLSRCAVDRLEDVRDGALEEIAIGEDRVSLLRFMKACLRQSRASQSL